jgi:hypothetical protein
VTERDLIVAQQRSGQRGPHPGARGVALGELVDLAVGVLRDALELALGGLRVVDVVLERPRRDPRGDLTGLGAPHPVRDGEHGRAGEVGVLVGVPLAAGVRLVGRLGDYQRHPTSSASRPGM